MYKWVKVLHCILNNDHGSFGPDIEDLLQDIGTVFTIVRDSGNITGEKLLDKINRQVTKPFIREFFLEAAISYNSQVISGDIIEFNVEPTKYLVVTVSPRHFENQAFDNQAVLYKCNVSGELLRLSGESYNPQTYKQESVWQTVRAGHTCTMVEEIFGNFIDQDEAIGQVENKSLIMYFPSSIDVQPLDRYIPISGEENFKIEEVERFRFPGVHVAHLEVDTRQ